MAQPKEEYLHNQRLLKLPRINAQQNRSRQIQILQNQRNKIRDEIAMVDDINSKVRINEMTTETNNNFGNNNYNNQKLSSTVNTSKTTSSTINDGNLSEIPSTSSWSAIRLQESQGTGANSLIGMAADDLLTTAGSHEKKEEEQMPVQEGEQVIEDML